MPLDFGKQYGPLPLGAWLAVIAGGLGIAYVTRDTGGGGSAPEAVPDYAGDPAVGAGGSGYVFVPPPDPTTGGGLAPAPTNNDEWAVQGTNWLIGQGYPPAVSDSALRKYLAVEQLSTQEYTLLGLVLGKFGSPPVPLPPGPGPLPVIPPPVPKPPAPVPGPIVPKPPPPKPPPPPPAKPAFRYQTVTPWPTQTSTLSGISTKWYKTPNDYMRIYNANRYGTTRADKKPGMIKDPNIIYAGWSLLIP